MLPKRTPHGRRVRLIRSGNPLREGKSGLKAGARRGARLFVPQAIYRLFRRSNLAANRLTGFRSSVSGTYFEQLHRRCALKYRQAPRTRSSSRLRRQLVQSGSRRAHLKHSGTVQLWSSPRCRQLRQIGIPPVWAGFLSSLRQIASAIAIANRVRSLGTSMHSEL